jgi:molybdopterin/thiamine biosynthesis adenylyltransferase
VDRDRVDDSSLNRSPLFTVRDVGNNKAVVTAAHLLRNGLAAEPHGEWFDEAVYGGHMFRDRPDLVIPTANDRDVRCSIQDQVPPLQIYGTTGRNWDAFLGRHIPLREDCLACRFPRPTRRGEPPLICATASIPVPSQTEAKPMDAALPFLSTAAGLLAVAELLKATLDRYPASPNFACLDFLGDLSDFVSDERRPVGSCQCASQSRIWLALNGKSRFASLSTAAVTHHDRQSSPQPGACVTLSSVPRVAERHAVETA